MYIKNQTPLTNEQLAAVSPSIMADHAHERVSNRYSRVSTIDVVDNMRELGWMPVRARQMKVRTEDRLGFCKHEIRFQRMGDTTLSKVGDETLQAVMTNSHDRSSAFHFNLGVFRLACENGLMVAMGMFNEVKIRHVNFEPDDISMMVEGIAEGGKKVAEHINAMKAVALDNKEQEALARASLNLLFDKEELQLMELPPQKLLNPRRYDDNGSDLWRTFNRIQENVMKGGLRYYVKAGDEVNSKIRRATTRQVA